MLGEKRLVDLGEFGRVDIDPSRLGFNEATISRYLEHEAGWYDYFGGKLADAEYQLALLEDEYDTKYSAYFRIEKSEEKASDKLAEARAKTKDDVVELANKVAKAKYHVALLKNHIKSWDRNHENVQNRGHTLRKEMDRITTIHGPVDMTNDGFQQSLDEIIKPANKQPIGKLS